MPLLLALEAFVSGQLSQPPSADFLQLESPFGDFSQQFEHFRYFLSTQLMSPPVEIRVFLLSGAIAIYNPRVSTPLFPQVCGGFGGM